ncbi:hypothetical protein ACVW0Y_001729 [Pseudomonas sp. TE3786]
MKFTWMMPVLLLVLAGCDQRQTAGYDTSDVQGEKSKTSSFLAYEHTLDFRLDEAVVSQRVTDTREACISGRFGACELLGIEQGDNHYRAASLRVRIVPEGVEPLVALAGNGGQLVNRQTHAEDLAQAVSDNNQVRERLQRQYKTLEQFQDRKDLSVSDMLALAREMAEVQVQLDATSQEAAQQQRRINTNLLTLNFSTSVQRQGRFSRIWDAVGDLLDNATDGTTKALEVLGYGIPFLIVLLPLALLVRWVWRKVTRRKAN